MIWEYQPEKPSRPRPTLRRVPYVTGSHAGKLCRPPRTSFTSFSMPGDPKPNASKGIAGRSIAGRVRPVADQPPGGRSQPDLEPRREESPEAACVAQLREHFDVLARLLRPHYTSNRSPFSPAERRDICRLIIEMDALLRQVEAALILREEKRRL